jgi:hypothetical protein
MNIIAFLLSTIILQCQGMRICDPSYTVKVPGGTVQFVVVQVGDEKYEFTYDPALGQTYVGCHDLAGYCAILGKGFGGALRETSIQPLAFDAAEIHVHYDYTVWLPIFQAGP